MSADARARAEQQLDQARAAFRRDSTNVDSIIWLGRRLAYLGRFRESIDVYSKGIARYPTNAWLYRHRGHRYITVRQLDRAIADLERAQSLVKGQPDQIEPDGQPNAQNTPIGTLHSNIAYHLGLAYYLKGDYARAVPLYQHEMAAATNDDRRVSTAHWLYMNRTYCSALILLLASLASGCAQRDGAPPSVTYVPMGGSAPLPFSAAVRVGDMGTHCCRRLSWTSAAKCSLVSNADCSVWPFTPTTPTTAASTSTTRTATAT